MLSWYLQVRASEERDIVRESTMERGLSFEKWEESCIIPLRNTRYILCSICSDSYISTSFKIVFVTQLHLG